MRTFFYSNIAVLYIAYSVSQNNLVPSIFGHGTNSNGTTNNNNNQCSTHHQKSSNIFIPLSIKANTNINNNNNNNNSNNNNINYPIKNKITTPTICATSLPTKFT